MGSYPCSPQCQLRGYKGCGLEAGCKCMNNVQEAAGKGVSDAVLLVWDVENLEMNMVFQGKIDRSCEQQIVQRLGMQTVKHRYSVCIVSVNGNSAAQ